MFITTRDVLRSFLDTTDKDYISELITRKLGYQEALLLLPEIVELLKEQGAEYLQPAAIPYTPRAITEEATRKVLMETTCIGTFRLSDTGRILTAVSFFCTVANAKGTGILSNIALDVNSVDDSRRHLRVYMRHLLGVSSKSQPTVHLVVNVSDTLSPDVYQYLTPALGETVKLNEGRNDNIIFITE